MNILRWIPTPLLCLALVASAFGACKIGKVAEIPVSVVGNRPLIDGQINGQNVKIFVDTGAQWTYLWEDAATQLGLPLDTHTAVRLFGAGGEARVLGTVLKQLQIGAFSDTRLRLAVIGTKEGGPRGDAGRAAALVLGYDFLSHFTTEFDLAHGVIRLLRPEGCQPDQMTYWSDTYAMAEIARINPEQARIQTDVLVNGKRIIAILDTGAYTSVIALRSAKAAGVTAGQAGTQKTGTGGGIAGKPIEIWVGTFDTFSIGDEVMRKVKLQISDLFTADTTQETGSRIRHPVEDLPSMLIGADFFLAHRIIVLAKEHKLLFTYNGGPVFQFVKTDAAPKDGAERAGSTAVPAASAATP